MFNSFALGRNLLLAPVLTYVVLSCASGTPPDVAKPKTFPDSHIQVPAPPLPRPAPVPSLATPAVGVPASATAEDQVLAAVSKGLRRAQLLTRPDQCYAYQFDPAKDQPMYRVEVLENHRHPECGGDPQTQPHLFTVHVEKTTGALSADAHSPGDFRPVGP